MAAYIEKYVSALATDGVGDGSSGNPWSWNDAVTSAANGQRLNVKADGTYTLAPNNGSPTYHYWIKGSSDIGTPDAPVCWRGYTTTPGDGGIVSVEMASDKTLAVYPPVAATAQRGCWLAENFSFAWSVQTSYGMVNSGNSTQSQPLFYNCKFRNTYTGIQYDYALVGSYNVCIRCVFQNLVEYATPKRLINECTGSIFLGCTFETYGYVMSLRPSGIGNSYQYCVFRFLGTTPVAAFVHASTSSTHDVWAHCVFDGFSTVLDASRTTTGSTGYALLLNNILRNIAGPIIRDSTSVNSRNYIVAGNKVWNASGVYGTAGDLFDVGGGMLDHYDSNEMWPWGTVDVLAADPFEDGDNGDYRIDSDSAGAAACMATAFPEKLYDDGSGTVHPFARDLGLYQTTLEADYPDAEDVRDGVFYNSGLYEGTLALPAVTDVRHGVPFDAPAVEQTGTCHVPAASDVRTGVDVDHTVGTLDIEERNLTFEDLSDVVAD